MSLKILVIAGLMVAFLGGVMASGIYSATTRAFNPPEEKAVTYVPPQAQPAPAVIRTHLVQPGTVAGLVYDLATRNK